MLSKVVNSSFKRLTIARGLHTHNKRFDSDAFQRLRVMEGLLSAPRTLTWREDLEPLYRQSYRDMRKEWSRLISENNSKIRKLLDQYCDGLRPLIFDGRIVTLKANRTPHADAREAARSGKPPQERAGGRER